MSGGAAESPQEKESSEFFSWADLILSVNSPLSLLDYLELPLFDLLDEFQWKLFKILLVIVSTNIALILFFWHVYGTKIVDKFMQPSSSDLFLEELKNSISELKLPKEHSPRI
jgi:hypothetical protein